MNYIAHLTSPTADIILFNCEQSLIKKYQDRILDLYMQESLSVKVGNDGNCIVFTTLAHVIRYI